MPGAPWHHWVRIVPLRCTSGSSSAGGQFACRPPGPRWLPAPPWPGEQLVGRQELRPAGERIDDPGEPMPGPTISWADP